MTRRRLGIAVRVIGLLIFISIFVHRTDVTAVRAALTRPGVGAWMAAAGVLYMIAHTGNGLGWRTVLRSSGIHVSFRRMFLHDLSSIFWSTVLPGGLTGEIVKGVRLAGEGGDGGTVAIGLVVSHLTGGIVSCMLALTMLSFSSFSTGLRQTAALALIIVASGAIFVIGMIRFGPVLLRVRLPWVAQRLPVGRFPSLRAIGLCGLCGLLTHSSFSVVYALCFGAAGHVLRFPDAAVLSTLTSVAQLAPVSFGGFGIRELSVSQIGGVLVPGATATATAAAIMVSVLWSNVVLLGGLVELARVRAAAKEARGG